MTTPSQSVALDLGHRRRLRGDGQLVSCHCPKSEAFKSNFSSQILTEFSTYEFFNGVLPELYRSERPDRIWGTFTKRNTFTYIFESMLPIANVPKSSFTPHGKDIVTVHGNGAVNGLHCSLWNHLHFRWRRRRRTPCSNAFDTHWLMALSDAVGRRRRCVM